MKRDNRANMIATIGDALPKGMKQIGATKFAWDVSGNCTAPISVDRYSDYGRLAPGQSRTLVVGKGHNSGSLELRLMTKCRKCSDCLRRRAALWRHRAKQEAQYCSRSWLVTLTLRPEARFTLLCKARDACLSRAVHYDELSDKDQFSEYWRTLGPELTKYVKRVRKTMSGPLRYMMVAESHKDGTPHVHALFHEKQAGTLKKVTIQEKWDHGFTNAKLVKDVVALSYVTKYLTKDAGARIRASVRYGSQSGFDADSDQSFVKNDLLS